MKRRTRKTAHASKGLVFTPAVTWEFGLPSSKFDYASEVKDGLRSSVVVAILNWKMRAFPEAPVVVERRENEQWRAVGDHALTRLLRSPNPFYSGRVLWMATVMDFSFGEAYWLKVRNGMGAVVELWWVPRALIRPMFDDVNKPGVFITHYEYRVGGQLFELAVNDVVHFRFGIDPVNTRRGFSPLAAVFREVYVDDQASNFTAAILRNLGIIGLIFAPKTGTIPSLKLEELKTYVQQNFTGDKRGQAMAFGAPTDAQVLQYNLSGFDMGPIRDIVEERVSAATGIPAAVVGFGTGLQQTKVGAPQPLSARLWTPTGRTTMGEVRPGDVVAIPGGWGRVQQVYPQGVQDIYRITFQDGSTAESTIDHLWDVQVPDQAERQILPLSEIARMSWWKRRRTAVPLQGVTEFAEQPTLIPPYVLGLLLADGCFRGNLFFSNADPEIVDFVREEVAVGYDVRYRAGVDYQIAYREHARGRGLGGGSGNINPFKDELRRLGLWNLYSHEKFIPDLYKYNSSRVRRELLRGLLDGDGYVNLHGQPALEQTSARLAADVTFLVQSLGGYTLQSLKRADRRIRWIHGHPMQSRYDRYHQSIVIADGQRLFRCTDKAARCRPRTKLATRKFRSIERVRREAAQCIAVEGGLYLTDNFIVTHNTMREMIQLAWKGSLMPEQEIVADELDRSLLPEFQANIGLFRTKFDTSQVRALWEDEQQKATRLRELVAGGVIMLSEARRDLGFEVRPEHDVYYRPTGVVAVQTPGEKIEPPAPLAITPPKAEVPPGDGNGTPARRFEE